MPSTLLHSQSGGIALMSGSPFSGSPQLGGGVRFKAALAPAPFYIGVANLSGDVITSTSGGSMSSGGMADGWIMSSGEEFFIPKILLRASGLDSIRLDVPAGASGGRLYWQPE